jgi:hypothetical protein
MLERTVVLKDGPFVGAECALCKQPFNPGDEIIVCPVDQVGHHVPCWQANANRCASLGCAGSGSVAGSGMGEVVRPAPPVRPNRPVFTPRPAPQRQPGIGRFRPFLRGCILFFVFLITLILTFSCLLFWWLWSQTSTPLPPVQELIPLPAILCFAILRG